jgi:hypothetical protein
MTMCCVHCADTLCQLLCEKAITVFNKYRKFFASQLGKLYVMPGIDLCSLVFSRSL